MILVDSHCHLDFDVLRAELPAVLVRAEAAGVRYMQTICTKLAEAELVQEIATSHNNIFCSVGVHPLELENEPVPTIVQLLALAEHPKVIGLGETGLDYHYSKKTSQLQHDSFKAHIMAAQKSGLPLIIHSRDADEDTLNILRHHLIIQPFTGVIHCFTGSYNFAMQCLDLGLYLSASGIITFKNAEEIRRVFAEAPMERTLIETDSPYLAPVPYRGKSNEPAYVAYVAECIAELKGLSTKEVAKITTHNFFTLFNRAQAEAKTENGE